MSSGVTQSYHRQHPAYDRNARPTLPRTLSTSSIVSQFSAAGQQASQLTGAIGQARQMHTAAAPTAMDRQRRGSHTGLIAKVPPSLDRTTYDPITELNLQRYNAARASFSPANSYKNRERSEAASKPSVPKAKNPPPAPIVVFLDQYARKRITWNELRVPQFTRSDGTKVDIRDLEQVLLACKHDKEFALLKNGTLYHPRFGFAAICA